MKEKTPKNIAINFACWVQDNYSQNKAQGSSEMLAVGMMRKDFTNDVFTISDIWNEYQKAGGYSHSVDRMLALSWWENSLSEEAKEEIAEDYLLTGVPREKLLFTGREIESFYKKVNKFKEDWGQTHSEVCANLGYDEEGSDELLMEDFFWHEKDQKWYNKEASSFTTEEEIIAQWLKRYGG